jgi:hypothetical protein
MLLPAPPLVLRKPRKRFPVPKTPKLPDTGLAVIGVENVVWDEPLLSFTLVLNTTAEDPLVADTLDPEKWSGVWQGGEMTAYSAEVVAFDRINVILQGTAGGGGASSVSYAADPSDVCDTGGRELAAFSDFPL